MIGIVLGLGFQNWSVFKEPWQYIAFIFAYLDIIDYWIDYSPSLKKFPPKREIDVFLDLAIMFSLFLLIYSTQLTIIYFLASFIFLRILDYLWLINAKRNHNPSGSDKLFVDAWITFDLIEISITGIIIGLTILFPASPLIIIIGFIIFRLITRLGASLRYKKVHFA